MTPLQKMLERLPDARQRGQEWEARCPSHKDRLPSLAFRERDDGALLICCRAGCSTPDVVAAIGLELHDLFPLRRERVDHRTRGEYVPHAGASVLRAMAAEVHLLVIIAARIANGTAINDAERVRARLAGERLLAGVDLALPPRDRRAEHRAAREIAERELGDVHEEDDHGGGGVVLDLRAFDCEFA